MKNTSNQIDLYEKVTDKIIEQMEQGRIPWQQPWKGGMQAISHSSGKAYSFLNQMLLGFKGGEWLTFNQCKKEGGSIRKGEHSSTVVFWQTSYLKNMTVEDADGTEKTVKILVNSHPILKSFQVFHISQCEGIKPRFETEIDTPAENLDPIEAAENVVGLYFNREQCRLYVEESAGAFYRPADDTVHVPLLSQYAIAEEYYSTLFHEMTHSTGHTSRLNRLTKVAAFGSQTYSREELVAEMGAAFMLAKLGIDCEKAFTNSVAYLQGWLRALKNDKKMIVVAAGKAEAAVEYILTGKKNEKKETCE